VIAQRKAPWDFIEIRRRDAAFAWRSGKELAYSSSNSWTYTTDFTSNSHATGTEMPGEVLLLCLAFPFLCLCSACHGDPGLWLGCFWSTIQEMLQS